MDYSRTQLFTDFWFVRIIFPLLHSNLYNNERATPKTLVFEYWAANHISYIILFASSVQDIISAYLFIKQF